MQPLQSRGGFKQNNKCFQSHDLGGNSLNNKQQVAELQTGQEPNNSSTVKSEELNSLPTLTLSSHIAIRNIFFDRNTKETPSYVSELQQS